MAVHSLQQLFLAVPDPAIAGDFYRDFGRKAEERSDSLALRCAGRDQDQIVLVEPPQHLSHGGIILTLNDPPIENDRAASSVDGLLASIDIVFEQQFRYGHHLVPGRRKLVDDVTLQHVLEAPGIVGIPEAQIPDGLQERRDS